MEDEFVVTNDFCAVFDGHGGDSVSRYLRANLYAFMQAALPRTGHSSSTIPFATTSSSNPHSLAAMAPASIVTTNTTTTTTTTTTTSTTSTSSDNDDGNNKLLLVPTLDEYIDAAVAAYAAVDAKVQRISHWSYQGSTALGVWVHDNRKNGTRHVIVTNVGDSRAVLYRKNGTIVPLSLDHKPEVATERARIEAVGGTVEWCGKVDRDGRPIQGTGLYRLNGSLGLSRAIGDRSERPAVSAVPDVCVERLTEDDEFVVLGTDGLWDVMSTLDVVSFIHALLDDDDGELTLDRDVVAAKLVEEALRRGSFDNVTVIILWLDRTFVHS